SVGVPTVGCHCSVCSSDDPRDKRLRPSILVSYDGHNILIDTTPDFRTQALRFRIERLDTVLFTHEHADHIMGLDDVRPYNFHQRARIPIYASERTMAAIHRAFRYIFDGEAQLSAIPQLDSRTLDGASFDLFGLEITPIPLLHGKAPVFGFRFGDSAYLTDHSEIPEPSMTLLQGLDVLFLDALRYKPHPTHSTIEQSLATARTLAARRVFFTHICHDLGHARTEAQLPTHVRLAYDGLEIEAGGAG
ncbi:MAG TPA: MBL fold metallo-hydrolase, partial [Burkholderiales bacterium]|nr:MBL fold metallo-hydrolase [Burkholderiales bacterium]